MYRQRKRALCAAAGLFLLIVLVFASLPMDARAMGEGDGGGGGPSVPLEMEWSYPANGAAGVSVHVIIQCKYSHNVANSDVRDRNAKKISLSTQDGAPVAAEVYLADAQLEFDKRQYIYLYPKQALEPYTTYVVTAEEGVQAKNSMATECAQTFRFTTGGAEPEPVPVAEPTEESEAPAVSPAASEETPGQDPDTGGEAASQDGSRQAAEPVAQSEQTAQNEPTAQPETDAGKAAEAGTPEPDPAGSKPGPAAGLAAASLLPVLGLSVLAGVLRRKRRG